MEFYARLILAIAALFLVTACSDDDTDTTTTASTGQNIAGTYSTGCVIGSPGSFNTTLSISSGVITVAGPFYASVTDCSGTVDYQEDATISIAFIDAVTLASGELVSRVDLTRTVNTITPNTDAGTTALNASLSYGISDWATGTARNVLELNDDGSTRTNPEKDLIYLNDTVTPNLLQLGDAGGTLDSSGYPANVFTRLLTKQ